MVFQTRQVLVSLLGAFLILLCPGFALATEAPKEKPKYGAGVTRLYRDQAYVRKNPAPDFWAMMPYYLPQQHGSSCSVASVAMVINAARAERNLDSDTELATEKKLPERVAHEQWKKGRMGLGYAVTLEGLSEIVKQALEAYGVGVKSVERVNVDSVSRENIEKFHLALVENEKSSRDFIILNFRQGDLTGDAEVDVGHISPVAAYDSKKRRVLIFDPDRDFYEPYWVPIDAAVRGMATRDRTAKAFRGYLHVRLSGS